MKCLLDWYSGFMERAAVVLTLVPRAYSAEVKGTISTDWYGLVPWNRSPMLMVLC